jgi:[ribosomal protein S5]-alanine N-acetyltransferase
MVEIKTPNLLLRFPQLTDEAALRNCESKNRDHWSMWGTSTDSELLHDYLKQWISECQDGTAARFFIFKKENPNLIIGVCNFTQIFHGPFQACYLGYKIDSDYEGKGLMLEALQAAIQYVFEKLHLHRIMANYMPTNQRSAKLLNCLGFSIEGHAKNYLLINGHWEDHVLTALSYEDWKKHQGPNKSELMLRKMKMSDIHDIQKDFCFPWTTLETSLSKWQRYFEEQSRNERIVCIVEKKNQIIGYGSFIFEPEYLPFQETGIPLISDVWILSSERGKGYATELINYIEEVAAVQGYSSIGIGVGLYADYGSAQKLYFKLGYQPDGLGVTYKNQAVDPRLQYPADDDLVLWMTKQLDAKNLF